MRSYAIETEAARRGAVPPPAPAPPELAAALGNRAFGALLARRRLQRTDAAPRIVETAYGTFAVHPDGGETLPPAEAGAGHVWPVTESGFARLQAMMATLAGADAPLRFASRVRSPEAFKPVVLLDLAWLQTQPLGAELLAAIAATHKVAWILETPGLNRTLYDPEPDASPDALGKRGKGANARIDYDPGMQFIHDGSEAWMHRPPAIGLAHELVHAWTGMTGTRVSEDSDPEGSERQAAGVGEFRDARFTENRFRAAFKLPLRPRL